MNKFHPLADAQTNSMAELIAGERTLEQAVHTTFFPNLDFIRTAHCHPLRIYC